MRFYTFKMGNFFVLFTLYLLFSKALFAFEYTLEKAFLKNKNLVKTELLYKSKENSNTDKDSLLIKIYEKRFNIALNTIKFSLNVLKNEEINKIYYKANSDIIKLYNSKIESKQNQYSVDEKKQIKAKILEFKKNLTTQSHNYKSAVESFERYTKLKFSPTNLLELIKQVKIPKNLSESYKRFNSKPKHIQSAIINTFFTKDIKINMQEYFDENKTLLTKQKNFLAEYSKLELKINNKKYSLKTLEDLDRKKRLSKLEKQIIDSKYALLFQKIKILFISGELLDIFPTQKELTKMTQNKSKTINQQIKKSKKNRFKHTTLKKIHFADGSVHVSSYSIDIVERNAYLLSLMKDYTLYLIGHSDSRGSKEENYTLGLQRAENTKKDLVSFGANPKKIFTFSKSSDEPIATNKTTKGRLLNRRVEFILKKKDD